MVARERAAEALPRVAHDIGDVPVAQRRRLWALAYRLTASAAEADDIVQETFARWLEHSAAGQRPSEAWLTRVATRLGMDALRARRRRVYVGTWLPEPIGEADVGWCDARVDTEADPAARYGLAESVTLAFLIALEALTPRQRGILLLRDVLGYSAAETAELTGTSDGNVRVLHLRARRLLASYDRTRCVPTPEVLERHRVVLERFLTALRVQDARALEELLTESVEAVTDGGGEFTALRVPLDGRPRVARFYLRAALNRAAGGPQAEIRLVNGLPTAVVTLARPIRRQAPLTVLSLRLAGDGRVGRIYTVLASAKLGRVALATQRLPADAL